MNGSRLVIPESGEQPWDPLLRPLLTTGERETLLFPFLEEGLRRGDKCLCLTDDMEAAPVRDRVVGTAWPGARAAIDDDFDLLRAADEMSWVLPGAPPAMTGSSTNRPSTTSSRFFALTPWCCWISP
ncbi:MEDS domain-containing protein [Lentzea sp. HUAS12]|uniref:MEDS domain-containing protein n=1 Tax=Lentzea sp. HUAS12 TaxID=2951806 RepID=UPI00209E54E2|nr:MEDS domain-containing protein [Lentzea sp. HUAS12]USX50620.1 MEDS domain-containing protein [Lentzea sp. HUAS12]